MDELRTIESKIKMNLGLIFVAPFIFAYWYDSLTIDFVSLILFFCAADLVEKPTIRSTVLLQFGLFVYAGIYCVSAIACWGSEKEVPILSSILSTLLYLAVSVISFRNAKLLSPYLAGKKLELKINDSEPVT